MRALFKLETRRPARETPTLRPVSDGGGDGDEECDGGVDTPSTDDDGNAAAAIHI